jgi:hypothetical protein
MASRRRGSGVIDADFAESDLFDKGRRQRIKSVVYGGRRLSVWFEDPTGWYFEIEGIAGKSRPYTDEQEALNVALATIHHTGPTRGPAGPEAFTIPGSPPPATFRPEDVPAALGLKDLPGVCHNCGTPTTPEPIHPKWGAVIGAAAGAYLGHLVLDDPEFVSLAIRDLPEMFKAGMKNITAVANKQAGLTSPAKRKPKKKPSKKNPSKETPIQ